MRENEWNLWGWVKGWVVGKRAKVPGNIYMYVLLGEMYVEIIIKMRLKLKGWPGVN
jgi:hypothetical protein